MIGATKTELQATYDEFVLTTNGFEQLDDHSGTLDLGQINELLRATEKEPILSERQSRQIIQFFISSMDKRLCFVFAEEFANYRRTSIG